MLYLSGSQTDGFQLKLLESRCNFQLLFRDPGALNCLFSSRFTPPYYVRVLTATGNKVWQGKEMTGSCIFLTPPPALLLLYPITFSYSSKLFSFGLLSSVFFMSHHLIVSLGFVLTVSSVLPLVFIPTLFLFLIFPLLVYTVLHGQFTKSDIHSPFSPETFNTIFNTETSKVENLEKERMKEN